MPEEIQHMTIVHAEMVGDKMLVSREELEHLVDLAKRSEPVDLRRDFNSGPHATSGKRRLLRFLGGSGRGYLFSHRWRANLMSLLLSRGDVVLTRMALKRCKSHDVGKDRRFPKLPNFNFRRSFKCHSVLTPFPFT